MQPQSFMRSGAGVAAAYFRSVGSRADSFKRPLLSVDVSVCLSLRVCFSVLVTLMLNISETKRVQYGPMYESAYSTSIGDVVDDVT